MAFCSNCGKELLAGAKFCTACGAPVATVASSEPKRSTVFEGKIYKCPHCGETLRAFETKCPTCGNEIRGVKSSSAISALAEKLEHAHSDSQRIIIIKNFPIPNTKEDIIEFMVLASTNFDASYYASHLYEDDLSDAWLIKIEQCHAKAKLAFGGDPDFERIDTIYKKIKGDCAKEEELIKSAERSLQEEHERTENSKLFSKSKLRIAIIVFAVLAASFMVGAFAKGLIIPGVIATAMLILFIVAFLLGKNIIPEKIKNLKLIIFIIALALFIPFLITFSSGMVDDVQSTEWGDIHLKEHIPQPPMTSASIIQNTSDGLYIINIDCSQTEFNDYIDECKNNGYNHYIVQEEDNLFEAYNKDGYLIKIQYVFSQMTIHLDPPSKSGP